MAIHKYFNPKTTDEPMIKVNGKSNYINILAKALDFIEINENEEGLVFLYDDESQVWFLGKNQLGNGAYKLYAGSYRNNNEKNLISKTRQILSKNLVKDLAEHYKQTKFLLKIEDKVIRKEGLIVYPLKIVEPNANGNHND